MILPSENPYGHTKKLRYFLEQLIPLRVDNDHKTVLDFGCGNGTAVTQYLSNFALRVVGVEHDRACREYAKQLLPFCQFYPSLFTMEAESFDAIVCADVIEHLSAPSSTLQLLAAVLKPDGFLLGSIPNGNGLFELENRLYQTRFGLRLSQAIEIALNPWRLIRPNRSSVPYNNNSPHVQFFTLLDFFDMVSSAGFYVSDLRNGVFLGSPPFTAHVLEKSKWLMYLNGYVADRIHARHASTWLFTLRKK